jgi:hypothetical protein
MKEREGPCLTISYCAVTKQRSCRLLFAPLLLYSERLKLKEEDSRVGFPSHFHPLNVSSIKLARFWVRK